MHREGEQVGFAAQAIGGAVALVHVEVDDQRPADRALALQGEGRHRDVVEDAEPPPPVAPAVVAAARGTAGKAAPERQPRGEQRAAGRGERAPRHPGIDRQADRPLDRAGHRPGDDLLDIDRVMGEADQVRARGLRDHEAVGHQAAGRDRGGELPVLAHREAVALRQRGLVGRVEHDRNHGRDPVDSGDDTDTLNAPARLAAGATRAPRASDDRPAGSTGLAQGPGPVQPAHFPVRGSPSAGLCSSLVRDRAGQRSRFEHEFPRPLGQMCLDRHRVGRDAAGTGRLAIDHGPRRWRASGTPSA